MSRFVRACMLGFLTAALPMVALATEDPAAETASRALPALVDSVGVGLIAVAAVLGLLLVASLGYLYRRERQLDWGFQRPDAPHQDGHH
ncbi:MAG: hypothetical protein O3B31_01595 [Chloroflexi bacterium]|nr:hypothetical protein [Chloroflexota bacterium]MDA1002035.1 hypothetical protein [Chloroflexota bacterium]